MPRGIKFPSLNKLLGEKLRRLRVKAGLSQEVVAERFKISPQQYGKYESGKSLLPAEFMEVARIGFPSQPDAVNGLSEEQSAFEHLDDDQITVLEGR